VEFILFLPSAMEIRSVATSWSKRLLQGVCKTFTRAESKYHFFKMDEVKISTNK